MPKVLISYLVQNSGHHAAARAIEAALRAQDPAAETLCVDLLAYTHPHWASIIQRTYMTTIRRTPEVWEALYDNPVLEYLTRKIRRLIQRGRSRPLLALMEDFRPDVAVCTQAHPLSVLNAYNARQANPLPLWAVITDYVPHRFWVMDGPADYVVPTQNARDRLVWLGVEPERIHVLGIPIHPEARTGGDRRLDQDGKRHVLVMGGSRGLGIKYATVRELDRSASSFTIDVVTGSNRPLRKRLLRRRHQFRHPIKVRGYVRDVTSMMQRAYLLISKPGGLTSAEAMAARLPMVLVRPLPGQEQGNTEVLVRHGAAVLVPHDRHVPSIVTTLLDKPQLLNLMRERTATLSRPDASRQIAERVLAAARRNRRAPRRGAPA